MFDSIAYLKTLRKRNTAYDITQNIQSEYSAIKNIHDWVFYVSVKKVTPRMT
jgi:hypothetical protein